MTLEISGRASACESPRRNGPAGMVWPEVDAFKSLTEEIIARLFSSTSYPACVSLSGLKWRSTSSTPSSLSRRWMRRVNAEGVSRRSLAARSIEPVSASVTSAVSSANIIRLPVQLRFTELRDMQLMVAYYELDATPVQ